MKRDFTSALSAAISVVAVIAFSASVAAQDAPSIDLSRIPEAQQPFGAIELVVWAGLARSKGEARRLIQGGGIYLNGMRVSADAPPIRLEQRLHHRYLVLRKGAKHYALVEWPV